MKLILTFITLFLLVGCEKNNLVDDNVKVNLEKYELRDSNEKNLNLNSNSFDSATVSVFKFDGSTNLIGDAGIIIKTENLPKGNEVRTIKLRVKPKELSGTILSYGKRDKKAQCAISFKPNGALFFWGWYADLGFNKILPTNEWSYIAINYDGENISLFLNDQMIANGQLTLDTAVTDSLTLGKGFKGEIADVEIFSAKKTPEENGKSEKQKVLEILDNI